MLLTRCPSCNTAFRITAELLKQASGQVRCGRCNHVFDAFAHLEETQVAPDAHGIGSYTPPADVPPSGTADELAETRKHQALSFAVGKSTEPPEEETPESAGPQPVTADEVADIADRDPAGDVPALADDTPPTNNAALLTPIDPDEQPELELPPDEWQAFYESQGLADDANELGGGEIITAAAADTEHASSDEFPIEADGDFSAPAGDDAISDDEANLADSVAEPTSRIDDPYAPEPDQLTPTLTPTDASSESMLLEGPDAEPWALASVAMGAGERPDRKQWWQIGTGLLAVVLLLQMGHHFRNRLAANAVLGPLVRSIYGGMAVGLAPDWDVGQYQIDDWIATADAEESGQNRLRITATLANRGPRDQPHPYVRLELKDRWDEPIGSRIFAPAEYLPEPPAPNELMAAGARVPALLAVVDPGDDAYGFELDVCMPSSSDRLRCANQKVF